MKLRSKVLTGLVATVLVLTMMVSTVLASTNKLPFNYPNEANAKTDNDVWVKIIGGKDDKGGPIANAKIAKKIASVDITFKGNCSFSAEVIYNSDKGWAPSSQKVTVKGTKKINAKIDGAAAKTYCEVIVNCMGKTEGKLAVTKMVFKDAKGKALKTWGK